MIQPAAFAAPTTVPPPRPERAQVPRTDAANAAGASQADARTHAADPNAENGEPSARAAGGTNRTKPVPQEEQATTTDRDGQDFASLLLPPAEAAPPPVAAATPGAPTAVAAEPPAASADQWLAMLAGVLAQPMTVSTPEPTATPVAPAGIPTSAPALPAVMPPVLGTALPLATDTPTLPSLAGVSIDAALGAALPAADATAADPALHAGGDARPAFDTMLGALNAPSAPLPSHTAREVAPAPAPLQMPTDPASGFDDGIGTHIAWVAGQRLGEARIQVSPEHLGPIEVTLKLDDARVDAHFHSSHVEVRAALEASVPRLREMLAQHGLQLGQADVGQRQWSGQQPQASTASPAGGADADATASQAVPAAVVQRRGLLDEYA